MQVSVAQDAAAANARARPAQIDGQAALLTFGDEIGTTEDTERL